MPSKHSIIQRFNDSDEPYILVSLVDLTEPSMSHTIILLATYPVLSLEAEMLAGHKFATLYTS